MQCPRGAPHLSAPRGPAPESSQAPHLSEGLGTGVSSLPRELPCGRKERSGGWHCPLPPLPHSSAQLINTQYQTNKLFLLLIDSNLLAPGEPGSSILPVTPA